jgi:hypothetical protein
MGTIASARRATLGTLVMVAAAAALAAVAVGGALAPGAGARDTHPPAAAVSAAGSLRNRVFASGAGITHTTAKGSEAISKPDDITSLGGRIYVAFQNGVGPQGEASTTGNLDSTVVEFGRNGRRLDQWDIAGKCDGLTADPALGQVIATVNEDAHSSFYLIRPGGGAVHYRYAAPVASHGGTDAIDIYNGAVMISGSAPGTTGKAAPQAAYPAVYRAIIDQRTHVARLHGVFSDEARATVANTSGPTRGHSVRLGLTDPDSNETVPAFAGRFAGDFMLTSQGDEEQIFVSGAGAHPSLSVLKLSASVDDTAWPSRPTGTLYVTDNGNDTINAVTGPFRRGSEIVATTPCDESTAPSTCPGPGFPANYLGEVNPQSGSITQLALRGAALEPQGMLFVP